MAFHRFWPKLSFVVSSLIAAAVVNTAAIGTAAIGTAAIGTAAINTAAIGIVTGPEQSSQRPPNIILITADDLGYGDLGCYGQQNFKTPTLDRLAAAGMRFTNAYAGSTVCAPSRCSLMTGLHSGHSRIRGNAKVSLQDNDVTIAEVLKSAGYNTAHIGKWGCAEPGSAGEPHKQGFDHWFGYVTNHEANNYYPASLWKNGERFPLDNVVKNGVSTNKATYTPDLFTADALRFVAENKDRPFFLYLAYTQPHANNEAGKAGMEVPDYGEYADKDWPDPEKGRAAMIAYMDRDIGRVLEKLNELNLDGRTLVLFTSDNGPHKEGGSDPNFHNCNGPFRGIKRDLYEGGIRVPLIVRLPGLVTAGSTSDHVCANWDLLPTIAEIAGAAPPKETDGISIYPTLAGEKRAGRRQPQHDFLYWEFHERGFQQAARMGKWKGILLRYGGELELYDLEKDLGEETNVAADHPQVVAKIESFLKTARSENPDWPIKSRPAAKGKGKSKRERTGK
jgi:arylsulfatase A-like enzyme